MSYAMTASNARLRNGVMQIFVERRAAYLERSCCALMLQKVYLPAGQVMQCRCALTQDTTLDRRLNFPPVSRHEHLRLVTLVLRLSWQSLL